MKRLMIGVLLVMMASAIQAQAFKGFWEPVPDNLFQTSRLKGWTYQAAGTFKGVWLVRPKAFVTAVQLNWNKQTQKLDASALNQAGLGVSYAHYIQANDLPYNNYSINALVLLGADIDQPEPATISIAVTGSFLEWVNIGGLYNITDKRFGILTGVSIKF